eukprot:scaffold188094_cov18-Prasinocladus_malaysianus.AAC.1
MVCAHTYYLLHVSEQTKQKQPSAAGVSKSAHSRRLVTEQIYGPRPVRLGVRHGAPCVLLVQSYRRTFVSVYIARIDEGLTLRLVDSRATQSQSRAIRCDCC